MSKDYDPSKVNVTFAGITITGYMKGTMVECSRNEETWKTETGAQGTKVRVKNLDKGGKCKVTLQQTSPSNTDLSNRANKDEKDGSGKGALTVEDLNDNTLWSAKEAWIVKPADLKRGDELSPAEWELEVEAWDWHNGSPA